MESNIGHSFEKLVAASFRVYKGVRFEVTKEGWCRNGVLCKNESEMDQLIEKGVNAIGKSINRIKIYD